MVMSRRVRRRWLHCYRGRADGLLVLGASTTRNVPYRINGKARYVFAGRRSSRVFALRVSFEPIEIARDHPGHSDNEHDQRDDQRAIDPPEVLLAPEVSLEPALLFGVLPVE